METKNVSIFTYSFSNVTRMANKLNMLFKKYDFWVRSRLIFKKSLHYITIITTVFNHSWRDFGVNSTWRKYLDSFLKVDKTVNFFEFNKNNFSVFEIWKSWQFCQQIDDTFFFSQVSKNWQLCSRYFLWV